MAVARRDLRRQSVMREMLDASWRQMAEVGVGELSLRRLARELGITAPSLYVYFDSKLALYDALFADAAKEFQKGYRRAIEEPDPAQAMRAALAFYVRFALEQPAKYQLHFQRPIPAFRPSEESFAIARETYELFVGVLKRAVEAELLDPRVLQSEGLDLITAMSAGLASQQLSNEPDASFATGRWTKLVPQVVEIQMQFFAPHSKRKGRKG